MCGNRPTWFASERDDGLRVGDQRRRQALHRDGIVRGRIARGSYCEERPTSVGRGTPCGNQDCWSCGDCTPRWNHAPRHQAREHARHFLRRSGACRLRDLRVGSGAQRNGDRWIVHAVARATRGFAGEHLGSCGRCLQSRLIAVSTVERKTAFR